MYISLTQLLVKLRICIICIRIYYLKHRRECCTENTARGGVSRDKYSTRRSRVLYLSRDMPPSAVFFVHTSSGGALSVILYFELLLSCKRFSHTPALYYYKPAAWKWSDEVKRWILRMMRYANEGN